MVLAIIACGLLLVAAVQKFGVDPKELLKFFAYSLALLFIVMIVALVAHLIRTGFKKLFRYFKQDI